MYVISRIDPVLLVRLLRFVGVSFQVSIYLVIERDIGGVNVYFFCQMSSDSIFPQVDTQRSACLFTNIQRGAQG